MVDRFLDRFLRPNFLKKLSILLAISIIFLTAGVVFLKFDYNFEKFYPSHNEDTTYFEKYREKFKSDNDYLLIAIERNAGVFDSTFLTKVDQYTQVLEQVPHVENVAGITNQKHFYLLPGGMYTNQPIIHLDSMQLEQDSIRLFNAPEYVNTMIAADGQSLCLFVKHKDYLSKAKCDEMMTAIHALNDKQNFENIRMAGRAVGQAFYIEKMNYELILFAALSGLLTAIFLFFTFRNIWGVIVPMIVLGSTVLVTLGMMGWIGQPVNILLTTLPTILFIVSISDVVHIVSRYLDVLRSGKSSDESLRTALKEVGVATFLTSVTTAIGFLSLLFVNLEPIQIYGLYLGIGVMIAFVLAILMLPVLIHYFPGKVNQRDKSVNKKWDTAMNNLLRFVLGHQRLIVIGTFVLAVLAVIGIFQIKANNYLMDDMKDTETLKINFNYFDAHYGGIRPFEMAIELKDESLSFWDPEILETMNKVEDYLEESYGVEIKQSLVQMIKVANKASYAGNPEYFELPESPAKLKQFKRMLTTGPAKSIMRSVVDSLGTTARISGGIGDIGNIEASKRNEKLDVFLSKLENQDKISFILTGSSHLMDKNMNFLALSLAKGIITSVLLVGLIMGLVFRSFRMALVSIIPNVVPILMIGGVMGYFGIPLRTSTAIIFTISFGIAVDDTIHILGKFNHLINHGYPKMYAIKRSFLVTGKAMILTTIILCSGFLLLLCSSFQGTFFLGLLLCLTLVFAVVFDLLLMPILLVHFYKPKKKK